MSAVPAAAPHRVTLAGPGAWERRVHVEHVWGTVVTFDLRAADFGPDCGPDFDEIVADAVAYLHQVDRWFSTYRMDSSITALRLGLVPLELQPGPVQAVLAACRSIRELTGGVFDPWAVPGGVDPSGYVKGWAAGQVADRIVDAGIPNVAVNAAGDIACRGFQAPDEPWAMGILNPHDPQQIIEVVRLSDGAVATSGLYERGAHIVDPSSARAEVWFDSATIVGPDAGAADALATAALIVGPDAVRWFADLPDWSGYFVKDSTVSCFGPAFPD